MSINRVVSVLAALSLVIGSAFVSLPVQARPQAPIAATAPPAPGFALPVVVPGSNLIDARYWRYHYRHRYGRHYHWRRHYYRRWHYRHRYHRY
jgi:hypothetical protein